MRRHIVRLSLAAFLLLLIWLGCQFIMIARPTAGPWKAADEMEAAELRTLDRISSLQGSTLGQRQNLRFVFTWPWHKYVSFSERPDGGADVLLAEAVRMADGKTEEFLAERSFALDAKQYQEFISAFDHASSGYRFSFGTMTFDGRSFTFERWDGEKVWHYRGNESQFQKDSETFWLVVELVRSKSGFAQDQFQNPPAS